MGHFSEQNRVALRAREEFLANAGRTDRPVRVRPEIAASWVRSMEKAVDPAGGVPEFHRIGETRLSTAALPVIDHYLDALSGTRTSLLFADARGRLLGRWSQDSALRTALTGSFVEAGFTMAEDAVGTNGVGTVLEAGMPVEVKGGEHFSDHYLGFTCVGAPIRDPITRRIVGVIDITSRIDETSTLAMPWVAHLARQIEGQLLDQATHAERALLDAYLLTTRRTRHPVLALNGTVAIGNSAASAILSPSDHANLWGQLHDLAPRTEPTVRTVELSDGRTLRIRHRAVHHNGVASGILIEAVEPHAARTTRPPTAPALGGLVGRSEMWVDVVRRARDLASRAGGIVVRGEAGTGKLSILLAALDHATPVVVDCNLVIVEGASEWLSGFRRALADPTGVIILRHLHTLEERVAQAVCSLLDEREQLPRITATVLSGGPPPSAPLLDRIQVHELVVPALRKRPEDIPVLLEFATQRASGERSSRWSAEARGVLISQPWPDNVRELFATVRRIFAHRPYGVIDVADLPADLIAERKTRRVLTRLERLERQEIIDTLAAAGGNKVAAADALKIARSTLYRKMASLDIPAPTP